MDTLLVDWTEDNTKNFFSKPMKVKHRAEETGLFTDEALAELIDKHPMFMQDVCTRDHHPDNPNAFRTGDPRGLSGKELLKAVKTGDIWINLRKVSLEHKEYHALMQQMLDDVKSRVPGFDCDVTKGGILISSKNARVPYHADQTTVLLWHIRGVKKVYVYPHQDTEFLPEKSYESIILGETTEDVPYEPHFEEKAKVLRLEPGELAIWPMNAPHKVENETFCVSVTMDCPTKASAVRNSIVYANGVLRRQFGMSPSYFGAGKTERIFKATLGAAMRKAKYNPVKPAEHFVTFKVDLTKPRCIQDVAPERRSF